MSSRRGWARSLPGPLGSTHRGWNPSLARGVPFRPDRQARIRAAVTTRKQFLKTAAALAAGGAYSPRAFGADFDPKSWSSVRDQFDLDDRVTNLSTFLLASHPIVVREAIERHRQGLDRDAKRYLDEQEV